MGTFAGAVVGALPLTVLVLLAALPGEAIVAHRRPSPLRAAVTVWVTSGVLVFGGIAMLAGLGGPGAFVQAAAGLVGLVLPAWLIVCVVPRLLEACRAADGPAVTGAASGTGVLDDEEYARTRQAAIDAAMERALAAEEDRRPAD